MRTIVLCMTSLLAFNTTSPVSVDASPNDLGRFDTPFDTAGAVGASGPQTLSQILTRVARTNPAFEALRLQLTAAELRVDQAELRPNPGFESEFENIGGDASGFHESEITLMLSQEFQIFGQRGARRQLAQADLDAVALDARFSAFDLFLDVKSRFYALAHAQKQADLAESSVDLARGIQQNIMFRLEKGAALQSELLLARLELQRAELARDAATQERVASQAKLSALWNDKLDYITVSASDEPDVQWTESVAVDLARNTDSSRSGLTLKHLTQYTRAAQSLAAAESKPGITLSGGYKHLQESGTNSFVFGLSFPLPLFNRNQGTRASLDAELRSIEFRLDRARSEVEATIRAGGARLTQLINQHTALDSKLLPTAEEAYETLQEAYKAGRLPYTNLLEAERSLIEIRFEHNDVLLAIHHQVIALERITGITLPTESE